MIEPNYTTKPEVTKIPLSGRVLVFGSGKLTHEDVFFDFSSATEVRCYDPIYQEDAEKPTGRDGKFSYSWKFDEACIGGAFDHVVALFSLHYEPAWIPTLSRLVGALKLGGTFYYAEDCGFRAVLDGTTGDNTIHSTAPHVLGALQQRHHSGVTLEHNGQKSENGSPWLPSIRASDYKQLAILLGVFGFESCAKPLSVTLKRTPMANLQVEARPYLPWKAGAGLLAETSLDVPVNEQVVVHQYKKVISTEIPETLLYHSPAAEVLRSLVFKHTTDAMAQLELILPPSTLQHEELDGVYSRLTSFGRAWLSILYQHIARQIPEIEAVQLIFQRVGDHEDMAEALTSYLFEKGDPVFLTCTRTASVLDPWDYGTTSRYDNYVAGLDKRGGYLAELIFKSGAQGVYWDGALATMVGVPSTTEMSDAFAKRQVPNPCLYIPARIAHLKRSGAEQLSPLTLIAMIVYCKSGSAFAETAWRNLHSLLLPLLDNVSARVALGEMLAGHQHKRLLAEREQSHRLLLLLQRPLDELTRAFNKVQAEAQEMQSILNDPQVALFNAHKLLADLFIEGRPIQISRVLKLRAAHNWQGGSAPAEDIRLAYAYALCRIFGRERDLELCQTVDAVEATAQLSIRDVHSGGAHRELLRILSRLLLDQQVVKSLGEVEAIIASFARIDGEDEDAELKRKGCSLDTWLKRVIFTPFKSFGSEWPREAFELAYFGENFTRRGGAGVGTDSAPLRVMPHITPLPQHAILDFIISLREVKPPDKIGTRTWPSDPGISYSDDGTTVEIILPYTGDRFYHQTRNGQPSRLAEFIRHAVEYRDDLGNCGDFLNLFGSLLTKALGLVVEAPRFGDWQLRPTTAPDRQMLLLGRVGGVANRTPTFDRFFEIYQVHSESPKRGGKVILRWSDKIAPIAEENVNTHTAGSQLDVSVMLSDHVPAAPLFGLVEGTAPENMNRPAVRCALHDRLEAENQSGFRAALGAHLSAIQCNLVGTNDDAKDASILFLHLNDKVEDVIASFLAGIESKGVILLSTTKNPHPRTRDAWSSQYSGKVLALIHEGEDFDNLVTRKKIDKLVKQLMGSKSANE